jgi:hypothetical protein
MAPVLRLHAMLPSYEATKTSAEAFKKEAVPPRRPRTSEPKRPVSHLHPQYGTFVSYRELCASKGQSDCGRLNYLDRCKLATSKLIVSGYHSCWGAARGDRGNERLSLFLPKLQDDLRNRPPPYSTAGRAHLRGLPAELPIADDGDWLTYRLTRPRFERVQ